MEEEEKKEVAAAQQARTKLLLEQSLKREEERLAFTQRELSKATQTWTSEQRMQLLRNELQARRGEIRDIQRHIDSKARPRVELKRTSLDPAVEKLIKGKVTKIDAANFKCKTARDEALKASVSTEFALGKKLVKRARDLHTENEDLEKQLRNGDIAKLNGQVALLRAHNADLQLRTKEMEGFVLQLVHEEDEARDAIEKITAVVETLEAQRTGTAEAAEGAGEAPAQLTGGEHHISPAARPNGTLDSTADTERALAMGSDALHHEAATNGALATAGGNTSNNLGHPQTSSSTLLTKAQDASVDSHCATAIGNGGNGGAGQPMRTD